MFELVVTYRKYKQNRNKWFTRFVYCMQVDLKLLCEYVNIRGLVLIPPRHRQVRLHSSFVVFYFVFVL